MKMKCEINIDEEFIRTIIENLVRKEIRNLLNNPKYLRKTVRDETKEWLRKLNILKLIKEKGY